MLSKVASAFALIMLGAEASEAEFGPRRVLGRRGAVPAPPTGVIYRRKGTINPKGTSAEYVRPTDFDFENTPKPTETINASCNFDFIGYSQSEGSLAIQQKVGDNVSFFGSFSGISEGVHALKVHEFGDLEAGCLATGPVYNPYGAAHGNHHQDIMDRRLGDLEQVQARMTYDAEYKIRDPLVKLAGPDSIVGRALVLYERKDDHDVIERRATKYRDAIVRKGMGMPIACCVVALDEDQPKSEPAPEEPEKAEEPVVAEESQPQMGHPHQFHPSRPALQVPPQFQVQHFQAPPQYRPIQGPIQTRAW